MYTATLNLSPSVYTTVQIWSLKSLFPLVSKPEVTAIWFNCKYKTLSYRLACLNLKKLLPNEVHNLSSIFILALSPANSQFFNVTQEMLKSWEWPGDKVRFNLGHTIQMWWKTLTPHVVNISCVPIITLILDVECSWVHNYTNLDK